MFIIAPNKKDAILKYAFINNKIGLATTIILFFCSCSKRGEVVDNPTTVDMLISRQVSFENTNPTRKLVREFLYDNQDRCTEIRFGIIDSSSAATAVFVLSRKINFFYNGNEKNPTRAEYLRNPSFTTTQPYYFFYSGQNTKLKDSLVTGSSYRIANRLMLNNNTLVSTIFSTAIPPGYTVEVDTIYTTNDNINRIMRKLGAGSSVPLTNNLFTYDNKRILLTLSMLHRHFTSHTQIC